MLCSERFVFRLPTAEIAMVCWLMQVQLAERIGIDRTFLADVERGKRNISILNLELIAKGLDVPLARLLSKF